MHHGLNTIKLLLPAVPMAYELLPEKFTMFELRKIYVILLDKIFDRRNFQRKILMEANILQLGERKDKNRYNPAILYSFDEKASKNITDISYI